jgi:hypothetical protein
MKAGKMGINIGKELANSAGKIINSCKVQLEYYDMKGYKDKIEFLEPSKEE